MVDEKKISTGVNSDWIKRVLAIRKYGLYNQIKQSLNPVDDAKLIRDVLKDVPRSFGGGEASEEQQEALTNVLCAFGKYDESEGYTQGMGFIASFAFMLQESYDADAEEISFWLMVDVSKRLPRGFFADVARDEIRVFEEIIKDSAPAIANHLQDELFSSLCYLVPRWFLSLFVFALPDPAVTVIWTEIFFPYPRDTSYPFDLLYNLHRVALTLVKHHSEPLLAQLRSAQLALQRIPRRYSGSLLEAELVQHRDSRIGLEFMQSLLEATNSIKDVSDATHLIKLVHESQLTIDIFRKIRARTLNRTLVRDRDAIFVVKIQRWYRSVHGKRSLRSNQLFLGGGSLDDLFQFCAGGSTARKTDAGNPCSIS